MSYKDFNISCASLCVWREARGEGLDGWRGVLHVINNRSRYWDKNWAEIVYQHLQFSSMTYSHDPQLCKVPDEHDVQFQQIQVIAQSVYDSTDTDLTLGSDHYFAPDQVMPDWAKAMRFMVKIGHHDFYKQAVGTTIV